MNVYWVADPLIQVVQPSVMMATQERTVAFEPDEAESSMSEADPAAATTTTSMTVDQKSWRRDLKLQLNDMDSKIRQGGPPTVVSHPEHAPVTKTTKNIMVKRSFDDSDEEQYGKRGRQHHHHHGVANSG